MTIDAETAEEIALFDHMAAQDVSKHRWYTKRLIVFERDGALLGFYYLAPASECQEGQDLFESDPVRVFPVVAREITQTVYEPAA